MPRKSTEAKAAATNGVEEDAPTRGQAKVKDGLGVEDLSLPRTMIQRLAKGVIPANTQIQKDAQLAIVKSATVFVSYLANSANDRAVLANKKTIQPKDVMDALAELEFEAFLPRCEGELALYNTMQCTKRNDYRRRVKEEKEHVGDSALHGSTDGGVSINSDGNISQGLSSPGAHPNNTNGGRGRELPPAAKRARTSMAGVTNGVLNGEDEADDTVDDDEEEAEEGDNEEQSEEEEEQDDDEDDEEGVDGEGGEDVEDALENTMGKGYGSEDDDEDGGSESE